MLNKVSFAFLLIFNICLASAVVGQVPVERSKKQVTIEGQVYYEHLVQAGQTPYSISKAYEVSLDELYRANPGIELGLKAGSTIRVPANSSPQPAAQPAYNQYNDGYARHTVKQGETIYGICKEYGISQDQLVAVNPDLKNGLKVGDILRIPRGNQVSPSVAIQSQKKDSVILHEVQRKETLYSLSRDYNVSIEEIMALNPETSDGLKKGQIVKIPFRTGITVKGNEVAKEPPVVQVPARNCEAALHAGPFRIVLMLPLQLERVSEVDVSFIAPAKINPKDFKSLDYIQFYEGFMMAVDTLQSRGMNLIVDVYDVPADSVDFLRFLENPDLKKANLIIGPDNSANIRSLSLFASRNRIYMLNPWFNHEMYILGSPYAINLVPQVTTQLRYLCNYMLSTRPDANFVIVHDKTERNLWVVDRLKEELDRSYRLANKPDGKFSVVNYPVQAMGGLQKALSADSENVLITVASNEAFISSYVARLNAINGDYKITLVGMPWWRNFDRIETSYLQSLNLHMFSRYYIDYDDAFVNKFISDFRDKFKVEPDPQEFLPFRAYDIAMYFGTALMLYGAEPANCFNKVPYSPMYTEFSLSAEPGSGFENQYINLYKIEDYKLINVSRKGK